MRIRLVALGMVLMIYMMSLTGALAKMDTDDGSGGGGFDLEPIVVDGQGDSPGSHLDNGGNDGGDGDSGHYKDDGGN